MSTSLSFIVSGADSGRSNAIKLRIARRFPARPSGFRAIALAAAAICALSSAQAEHYKIADLGTAAGQANSWDWQQTLNNRGTVAVYSNNIPDPDAFSGDVSYLWSSGHVLALPGLPGAIDTIAFALNDFDQAVGRSTVAGQANSPVLWDSGRLSHFRS